ncbi:hypothetical protein COU54_04655 [Candidatus Pacearchaeota archaeon CG10_big_fil_rev_8_21_14_0_10_31_24]|nr:MAG: hypothetical protein COU54_04655 [Candidatus Pacearchaeota archaeon CG10_big_fil_rev_8_21_14_0_10_31_24]
MTLLNIQPREYQTAIFETTKKGNSLVVLPTGLGKTLIALLLTIHRLKEHPTQKILFLAPTRPLVEQHYDYFKKHLSELFADLQLFTGEISAETRKKIWQTSEVIFSTPQCIANDLTKCLYKLDNTSLLIIDEAHRCLKNYDYTKVVKYYKSQAQHIRILGLTASPGQEPEKVRQICEHLDIEEIEIRSRDSLDVKSFLQHLEFQKREVEFPKEFIEIKILLKRIYDSKVEKLQKRNLLHEPANKITLLKLQARLASQISSNNFHAMIGMSLTATAIKISHAIELLETQTLSGLNEYFKNLKDQSAQKKSKAVQTLVSSPEFQAADLSLQNLLKNKIEHPKIEELVKVIQEEFKDEKKSKIIIFTQFRETATTIKKRLESIPELKPEVFVGQAKKAGSGLSQKEQKAIIEKFRENTINTLICTSIGEEGLDIPEVSAVIFYEPIPSAIRKIQRAGRTARLAPGKLFILITLNTRDQINYFASNAREKKMYKTLDNIKEQMKKRNMNLDNFKNKS